MSGALTYSFRPAPWGATPGDPCAACASRVLAFRADETDRPIALRQVPCACRYRGIRLAGHRKDLAQAPSRSRGSTARIYGELAVGSILYRHGIGYVDPVTLEHPRLPPMRIRLPALEDADLRDTTPVETLAEEPRR